MKISKLFHWLYALLMLLPAFFVGGRMAYTIFNKNAKESYSGANGYTIDYQWETNEVNSIDDLIPNHIYKLDLTNANFGTGTTMLRLMDTYGIYKFNYKSSLDLVLTGSVSDIVQLHFNQANSNYYVYSNNNNINFARNQVNDIFYVVYYGNLNTTYLDYTYFSESDYNQIEGVDISNLGTLDNAFDYSINQINELPLFSWAKDSFIVQPFTYITGLFGMPSDSPVLTLLSYWCSISLIWLTFDLLMYVPLLVHRWLDKGVLE